MKMPHKKIRMIIKVASVILFLFSISKTVHKVLKNGGTDSDGTRDDGNIPDAPDMAEVEYSDASAVTSSSKY
jgi:hypothetical protein